MPEPSKEPGWYADQHDPELDRYWNGRAWTARRRPKDIAPATPATPTTPRTRTARRRPADGSPPSRKLPIWLWIVGGLMLARSIVGVVAAFDDPVAGSTTAGTTSTPSVSTTAGPH